jgi:hypothetical protein
MHQLTPSSAIPIVRHVHTYTHTHMHIHVHILLFIHTFVHACTYIELPSLYAMHASRSLPYVCKRSLTIFRAPNSSLKLNSTCAKETKAVTRCTLFCHVSLALLDAFSSSTAVMKGQEDCAREAAATVRTCRDASLASHATLTRSTRIASTRPVDCMRSCRKRTYSPAVGSSKIIRKSSWYTATDSHHTVAQAA